MPRAPTAARGPGRAHLPRLPQHARLPGGLGAVRPRRLELQLRCPECETRREVTLGRASVEQFNRELYHGAQAIAREAARMMRRNFEEEVERIVAALERDLIQPMDF